LYNWRFDDKFDMYNIKHWKLLPELLSFGSRLFVVVSPEDVKKNMQITLRTSL